MEVRIQNLTYDSEQRQNTVSAVEKQVSLQIYLKDAGHFKEIHQVISSKSLDIY